jgi:hypothetical protein
MTGIGERSISCAYPSTGAPGGRLPDSTATRAWRAMRSNWSTSAVHSPALIVGPGSLNNVAEPS